ncbi:hypothetical protein L484_006818 [Morus notabilis]|uniref:Uncharacterized protein n=1 Tax=Morus notabilis TaxID=981085 RepID=W9RP31_9ROSA|nr:hypothetical protein L484_006818 [Morus notabilis]
MASLLYPVIVVHLYQRMTVVIRLGCGFKNRKINSGGNRACEELPILWFVIHKMDGMIGHHQPTTAGRALS